MGNIVQVLVALLVASAVYILILVAWDTLTDDDNDENGEYK